MFSKILSFIKQPKQQKITVIKTNVHVIQTLDETTFNIYSYEYVKNDNKLIYHKIACGNETK